MSEYILFSGVTYYAKGGANDLVQFGDSIKELQEEFEKLKTAHPFHYEWYQITDRHLNIVSKSELQPHGNF